MAATDALASPDPRPKSRLPSIAGVNGSRVQPAPGGTTSRWEASAIVGPAPQPLISIRTALAFRSTGRPHRRVVSSMKTASSVSCPLTEGMAISSRSRSTSPGKIHPQICRLLLATHDHGATARPGKHFEQQRIGDPAVDDVGTLDATGSRANARLDLRPHAAAEHTVCHETGKIIGIGKGDQCGRIGA